MSRQSRPRKTGQGGLRGVRVPDNLSIVFRRAQPAITESRGPVRACGIPQVMGQRYGAVVLRTTIVELNRYVGVEYVVRTSCRPFSADASQWPPEDTGSSADILLEDIAATIWGCEAPE